MQGEMTEHDEHRICSVLSVLRRTRPIRAVEGFQACHETLPVRDELI